MECYWAMSGKYQAKVDLMPGGITGYSVGWPHDVCSAPVVHI